MSTDKITPDKAGAAPGSATAKRVPRRPVRAQRDIDVLSLEIDDDFGSDPYNRTGQHVIIDLKDYE